MELLLWAERRKLRRSKILWIAGFATVMVALIVFAQGQFTFYESRYIDGAGWFMTAAQSLATFYVLPAVIALLGSYMICREEQEDTLKSLRLIPVDEVKLTLSKMMLALVFSVLIYLLLFAITFLVEAVLHFEALSIGLVLRNLKTYLLDGIGVFFAISPIIALVARMKKGYWLALVFAEIYSFAGLFASMSSQLKTVYPMTAVFNISGYEKMVDGKLHCLDNHLPFKLPDGWAWCNLSMVGTTNIGLTYRPTDIEPSGIMVLRSCNIVNDQVDLSDLVRVRTTIRENQFAQKNDILICARNGSRSLVGKCALIPDLGEPASFGAFMAIYRTEYFEFIVHYLRSSFFRSVFDDSNSTAINQLTQDMLKRAIVPLPPLSEQRRIVETIDAMLFELNQIEKSLS